MNNRKERLKIAHETVEILDRGAYINQHDQVVNFQDVLEASKSKTKLYRPEDLTDLLTFEPESKYNTTITVNNCTTFDGASRLLEQSREKVLCLNFASAKNPGGGFLGGSQAQEECLARASGLYYSLLQAEDYYTINRGLKSSLYTDHMIYTPNSPVFRDNQDKLLDSFYEVSFITAPAVNKGAMKKNEVHSMNKVVPTMRRRIEALFAIAYREGYENLVLGAWGCGVFRNDPHEIAELFAEQIKSESSKYYNVFRNIEFAVLDGTERKKIHKAFYDVFVS